MIDNEDVYTLSKVSFQLLDNGFRGIQWCARVRGMLGAMLAELLHAIQKGLHVYALESLFGEKKDSMEAKKKKIREIRNVIVRQRARCSKPGMPRTKVDEVFFLQK